MVDLTLSQRIEKLLAKIAPSISGLRHFIETRPYEIQQDSIDIRMK